MTPLIQYWLPCFTVRVPDPIDRGYVFEGRPVYGVSVTCDFTFELGTLAI